MTTKFRRFRLQRHEDASGVSGTGLVAEGVQFSDGHCAMRWLTDTASVAIYDSIDDLEAIHGHEGRTVVEWVDQGHPGHVHLNIDAPKIDEWPPWREPLDKFIKQFIDVMGAKT